jgi:ABC-type multidrug transport system fused ATPase/permease subunit
VTTIIIAHRLSTIRNVDNIHVIASGMNTESGSHDELMSRQGYYYRLVQNQSNLDQACSLTSSAGALLPLSVIDQSSHSVVDGKGPDALIEFKEVQFSYPTRPTTRIINNFNLTISKGETIAFVGPSVSPAWLIRLELCIPLI